MSDVRAFRALRYDARRVDLSRVLVPPYDVVGDEDRACFLQRDPHSAIRLEHAAEAGVYALRQRFTGPQGMPLVRDGFFGLLRLEDYERGVVRPHERTLAAPKADRLELLRATRANLSCVFLLYQDRADEFAGLLASWHEGQPAVLARDDAGVEHALCPVEDRRVIDAVRARLSRRSLVIADGHHRYETALRYRDERRAAEPGAGPEAAFEFVLAYFANALAPGSLLLPIHRVVRRGPAPDDASWAARLPDWSQQRVRLKGPDAVPAALAQHLAPLRGQHAFAAYDGSGLLRVFRLPAGAAPGEPSVGLLHREVLAGLLGLDESQVSEGALDFTSSAEEAARAVRAGRGVLALYLNPLTPEDVFRVTAAGGRLPQKSTFFYPKLPSGLVFRLLGEVPA
jgi:uncharacterized protein (DUF1015 family)